MARRIQQASLPKEMPELEGWKISPYYRPAREVGGDFYDFHLLLVPLFRESPSPTFGEAGSSRCASLKRSVIVVPITLVQTGRSDDISALHHWSMEHRSQFR